MPITAKQIAKLYFYGSGSVPSDKTDPALIRQKSATAQTSVNINDYMGNGPGRFASAHDFDVINYFFNAPDASFPAGSSYNEAALRELTAAEIADIQLADRAG